MTNTTSQHRKPRFQLSDRVVIAVLGMHSGRQGVVVEVIEPRAGDVYHYRVRFADGTTATFLGFELNSSNL